MTLYHISNKYLGKKPILTPRIPLSAPEHEGDTLRICVSLSVTGCYIGLEEHKNIEACYRNGQIVPYHVYAVETDTFTKADKNVKDRLISQEKWLLEPHQFTHIVKMPKIKCKSCINPRWSSDYQRRKFREFIESEFQHQKVIKARKQVVKDQQL